MSTMIEQMLHIYFKKSAKLEITKRELCAYFILNFRLKDFCRKPQKSSTGGAIHGN